MGINISGLGAANGIGFKSKVSGGRYLPPDLKARLVSVTSCYGKKNTDSDKDILKDKTGQGNDLIVYNGTFDNIKDGYDAPFFSFMNPALTVDTKFVTYIDEVTLKSIGPDINRVVLYTNPAKYKKRIPSFIINVNCSKSCRYYYIDKNKPNVRTVFNLQQGVNAVPESYADLYSGTEDEGAVNAIGFALDEGATLEVKQLSRYTGGLLTSGINGVGTFVESVKPFKEMVGDSQSVSIVSMISILEPISINYEITINNVRAITNELYGRNVFKGTEIDKTYIIGYYANLPSSTNNIGIINNILGDDKDWTYQSGGNIVDTAKLSIQGFRGTSSMPYAMVRSVIYWNIVLKGKATIDEINQVIEYFNLDRPGVVVKPDILYDIKRQGITNDNHAEFEDKLKDFIYGFDMQMYNMNWEGTSGINTYPVVFGANKTWYSLTIKNYEYTLNPNIIHLTHIDTAVALQYTYLKNNGVISNINREAPAFKLKVTGLNNNIYVYYRYLATSDATTISMYNIKEDGIYDIPKSYKVTNAMTLPTVFTSLGIGNTDGVFEHDCNLTLEILPDNEGALNLNGINNFGKVTNVPVWKDYTIASLRKWLSNTNGETGSILSKSIQGQDGAFIFEQTLSLTSKWTSTYNFGLVTSILSNSKLNEKSLTYQTKYTYGINEQVLQVGTGLDTSRMWLGTIRDGDNRFSYISIWSAMLFRYTMSKFLLERQLKKYKIGSFYDKGMVIWRPEVTSNNSNYVFTPRIRMSDGTIKALINGEYYNPTDANLVMDITVIGVNEVTDLTINKQSYKPIQYPTYWRVEIPFPTKSPQRISITIEEYVRYESIVQPYPVMFKLVDKDTNKKYTWGDKVKVGSTIKVNSIIYNYQTLWSIHGYLIGNDPKTYSYNEIINKDIVVTKPLSFSCKKKWLLSAAEPLFVYDPAIFTNNAIKTLGYLPDISGQNRHLKLYNFSYEGMSGKDGYPVVFGKNKTWENIRPENDNWKYSLSSTGITIYKALDTTPLLYTIIRESGGTIKPISIPSFKINVKGLQDGESIRYRYFSIDNPSTYSNIIITKNGKHELPASVPLQSDSTILDVYIGFQVILNNNESVKGLIIEILPDYKDSLYFNGITNAASVLNLDHGGKCLVTKINYKFNQETICIYDQRKNTLEENIKKFALLATQQSDIAYGNGLEGNTYINNVLNNYVKSSELENVEHVATLVSSVVTDSNTNTPLFGRNVSNQHYAQFAMYRTILLPEVPNAADRAILNKWCGLPTGYLPKPEYYWDVTGKSNSDTATRNTIKNLGTAKPVASTSDEDAYSLENKNVAYEGMSGYNGYPVVFGANKTWETLSSVYGYISDVTSTTIHVTMAKNAGIGLLFSYVKKDEALTNIKEIPAFRVTVKGLEGNSKFGYRYLATEDATGETLVYLGNGTHELAKSFAPTEALLDLTRNAWVGIFITPMVEGEVVFDCDITIEVLPEYENGLVYDGITDYSKNANIPALDDFTAIIKRKWLKKQGCPLIKGSKVYEGGNGNALLLEWDKAYNFVFYKRTDIMEGELPDNISFITPTNYNGNVITRGSEQDTNGICIAGDGNAGFANMVFYKLILYPKTIPLLQINFLKNLMERDEIIDLTNPIFIKNE
jgi:hypothetical protein